MKLWHVFPLLLLLAAPCFGSSIAITTTALPNGTVGTAYAAAINASGGCTPYIWSLVSGSLPHGVTAKPSSTTTSLNVAGTPKTAATYSFTEQVAGCGAHVSRRSYSIVIQSSANHVVNMNWKASTSTDVSGYNLYRAPDGVAWKKVNAGVIGSTLYSDSTVANGSTYYYAATAVDIYGHESNKSSTVKVVVP